VVLWRYGFVGEVHGGVLERKRGLSGAIWWFLEGVTPEGVPGAW